MADASGRPYLPEYRNIRAKAPTFLDFCYSPTLAAEATLQPIRRFGFDAAILFSDILVIPDALGQKVGFESGEGPRLAPIESRADFEALRPEINLSRLEPVFETLDRVRADLPADVALIGFCGAPWTVASYMIAGRGTPDQAPARLFAYRNRELFDELIAQLVDASADYLLRQLAAGAQAVQIFDSWAGVLPVAEFERWCLEPARAIVTKVRSKAPHAPIIAFPAAPERFYRRLGKSTACRRWASTHRLRRSGRRETSQRNLPCRAILTLWPWSPEARRSTRRSLALRRAFPSAPYLQSWARNLA